VCHKQAAVSGGTAGPPSRWRQRRSLEDVRRASLSRPDCIFLGHSFHEANAKLLSKNLAEDAGFAAKREACLEEVLQILSTE